MAKEIIFEDNFRNGFDAGVDGTNKWNYMVMGPISLDSKEYDLDVSDGIVVTPKMKNPITGDPMFSITGPGLADHMKWCATINNPLPGQMPGVKTVSGKKVCVEALLGGRTFGTDRHPFGNIVKDPSSDPRLAASVLMMLDPVNMIVFDFFITDTKIYAIYERGKSMGGDTTWAVYSYAIPLADKKPEELSLCRIEYDYDHNTVSWYVNDEKKYETSHVGMLIDRKWMLIDNGGEETEARPEFFTTGLALFSLMDGAMEGKSLVNLTGGSDYRNPQSVSGDSADFFDNEDLKENRLFGQGAQLSCKEFRVYYR